MEKSISVFCADKYLRQKIYLILSEGYSVRCADIFYTPTKEALASDIIIWNTNDKPLPEELASYAITIGDDGDIPLPFSGKMLLSAIAQRDRRAASAPLTLGERCAHLYGKTLRFTEAEFALLSALAEAKGEFVSRGDLIHRVWGDGTTEGILNVYVHYLREKLEFRGEKVIVSSRKFGYKIDEKYFAEGGDA